MTESEALNLINTTPSLQSILYDCGMLPEQTEKGSQQWIRMLAYALAYQAGLDEGLVQANERLRSIFLTGDLNTGDLNSRAIPCKNCAPLF